MCYCEFSGPHYSGFLGAKPRFRGKEFCLSTRLEASFQSVGTTHRVALREFFALSGLVPSSLQNEALGKLRPWSPLSSGIQPLQL